MKNRVVITASAPVYEEEVFEVWFVELPGVVMDIIS
jgi:hypothetical protein